MAEPNVISIRRTWNLGAYETLTLETSWVVQDPDKTLRATEEELHLARCHLTHRLNVLALQEVLRIYNVRGRSPHPNVEVREAALSVPIYVYNQLVAENQTLSQEIQSLEAGNHRYGPDGMPTQMRGVY